MAKGKGKYLNLTPLTCNLQTDTNGSSSKIEELPDFAT